MRLKRIRLTIFLLGLLVSCNTKPNKKTVFVSILPQKYFVEQLAGNLVEVEVMVQPGASPATYEITPRQMGKVSEALIFFRIGVPFEKAWLSKIQQTNPNLRIVDTQKDIGLQNMQTLLDSGEKHENRSQAKDPHIWLSPLLVKKQAENIAEALKEQFPQQKEFIKNNLNDFQAKMQKLHEEISSILAELPHRKFLVFHPSWGYFAQEFNLTQIPIQIEGKSPNSKKLAAIIDIAKRHHIKTIFIQKQFNTALAKSIAEEIGGNVVSIDPLAPNYYENLKQVAVKMREVLDE